MRIAGIQGLSLIDYPAHIASVLFIPGCDFRCPFCQNPDLLEVTPATPRLDPEEVLAFLRQRKKMIDGIVITGGEPLLYPQIVDLIAMLRENLDLPIKIDTNGNHPDLLKRLLAEERVQYVAMDLKTAPSRYNEATGKLVDLRLIEESIDAIIHGGVPYEFRTTMVPGLIDEAAIDEMSRTLAGARRWAFQQFQNRVVYDESFKERRLITPEKIRELVMRAESAVEETIIRGL